MKQPTIKLRLAFDSTSILICVFHHTSKVVNVLVNVFLKTTGSKQLSIKSENAFEFFSSALQKPGDHVSFRRLMWIKHRE